MLSRYCRLLAMLLMVLSFSTVGKAQCNYSNNIVVYGDALSYPLNSPNVIRIFIDQFGLFYPDTTLDDAALTKNCGSIRQLLLSDELLLHSVSLRYLVASENDKNKQVDAIQLAIVADITNKINARERYYKRTDILIHGFRKIYYGISDGTTSAQDNKELEEVLAQSTKDSIQFVEVYWDSKYRTQSLKDGGIKRGLRLFEEAAIPSAYAAGLALRQIVTEMGQQHLNIITHSLGALVASEMLFNTGRLPGEVSVSGLRQKDIRWCMIAPAIGSDLFEQYYSRSVSYKPNPDNYKIFIAYNQYDFVLMKKFKWHGLGKTYTATRFGNTSLGCDYNNDIVKFQKWISVPPYPVCVDFSQYTGYAHHINQYIQNPAFTHALTFLK